MNPIAHLLRAATVAGALPLTLAAQSAAARVDTTLTLERGGVVQLGAVAGEIRVTGSDRRDVRISASLERGRFELTVTPGRIALATRSVNGRQGNAIIEVQVPQGTRVSARTVSGLVEVRGTQGEVEANSTSGRVRIREARERVDVETVSGNVELMGVSGRMRVEGVSADITAEDARGDLTAETVSGDIAVRRSALDEFRAEAVSGSIAYQGNLAANGTYRMNTHSGSIGLTLPAGVGARLELQTFSGRISSDFPLTMQPGDTPGRGQRMEFTVGNGAARVTAGAFSGNITIRRAGATDNRE